MAGEASTLLDRRTTKTRSVIFGALRSVGQKTVADTLGIGESTFCEWLTKNGDRMSQVLTATNLKPVPIENICYSPEHIEHLQYFARIGMAQEAPKLDFGDDEP